MGTLGPKIYTIWIHRLLGLNRQLPRVVIQLFISFDDARGEGLATVYTLSSLLEVLGLKSKSSTPSLQ